ncbi:hypothetical protein [Chitinophaga sp. LS1]|uniref:hypothetical protein n=1 Tax=Chitinophaga sp. LS1 TaxID=3051176 RepID=UPI002AAB2093|nr:hypothetical protein [Chitinophaga sp. LS1]WPV67672.1 hypothetical protein QQL36_02900 [Chitinophaga sp. LS1]
MKSSLTGKRVRRDPVFRPLMEDAGRMKVASPLAARVYRELEIGDVQVYRKMVGRAKELLKRMSEVEIEGILRKENGPVEVVKVSTGGSISVSCAGNEGVSGMISPISYDENEGTSGKIIPIGNAGNEGVYGIMSSIGCTKNEGISGKIIPIREMIPMVDVPIFRLYHFSSFYKSSA